MRKKAIIVGAGPAGLTAAYELLKRTEITPIIIEKCDQVGGISKTVDYKGNKMDFGPHRFFSKSDRVMKWWTNIMPLYAPKDKSVSISYQNKTRELNSNQVNTTEADAQGKPPADSILLLPRLTRIYFLRKFFSYPIQLSMATLGQLGIIKTIRIVLSYFAARLMPRKPEKSLEDFMINKFGKVLYSIFFKDYTEKVWGMPCSEIPAEWGAQRIKGVSLSKAIIHAAKALRKSKPHDLAQKDTETSLIEQFLYPAMGAGAMWEEVARQVEILGGQILTGYDVKKVVKDGSRVVGIIATNQKTGEDLELQGDYFISTMPVQELVSAIGEEVPADVKQVAAGLMYRDFVYVGVLANKMAIDTPKDSWIYIQEAGVKVARLQIYNNWGPYMVSDPTKVWLGLEYFCTKGDDIWGMTDEQALALGVNELSDMGLVDPAEVVDGKVNRMEKTYPAYFGAYERFDLIRTYLDAIPNLFLIGRNGMHKYNNSDHSMLTAMVAVDNIVEGRVTKENLWEINTEQEYHEEKAPASAPKQIKPETLVGAQLTFNQFVFGKHRWILALVGVLLAIQFIWLKKTYPFANFIPDSYAYIEAAWNNNDINLWPIGYSKFLRIFSAFFHTDIALLLFQYLAIQAAALYFIFSFSYLINENKLIRYILLTVAVINPAFLHLANFVTADALFTALSITWLAQMMWMIYRPSRGLLVTHGLLLTTLFTLRYNALFYPIISILVLLLSSAKWKHKLATVVISVTIISLFVWHTSNQFEKITGSRQFSPFSGWQMANNALYMYSHINNEGRTVDVPEKFKTLDDMTVKHFDSLNKVLNRPDSMVGIYYLWDEKAPLKKYAYAQKTPKGNEFFMQWTNVAPLYYDYGKYLILNNISDYVKFYLYPNLLNYYLPKPEFMSVYNMGQDSIGRMARNWFGFKAAKVRNEKETAEITIIEPYKPLVAAANAGYLLTIVGFLLFGGWKAASISFRRINVVFLAVYITNLAFSVLASPIVMRYQLFLLIPFLAFALIHGQYLLKAQHEKKD